MRPSVLRILKETMAIDSKTLLLTDAGVVPNNHPLPLRAYRRALILTGRDPANLCEDRFHAHRKDG